MFYGYKRMKYLVLLFTLFMVSNVKADYNENIDYQTNALRSYVQKAVNGVPINNEEPLDFSLSDLPLRENTEDVGILPYDKERSAAQKVGDFAQDLGANVLGGMAQIVPTALQVGASVPRQVNSLEGKAAGVLGLEELELKLKEYENYLGSLVDNSYSGIRQGVEELTSDYSRYAKQKGFRWDDLDDESLYLIALNVSEFLGCMAIPLVILLVLRKYIFYKPKYLILLFGSHMLYWAGISANEIQHDSYEAFDRVPLEYKMYSPKFRNILELVQRKKTELTPEQQLEYANSLARTEFGKDTTFSVLGALTIATDSFGDSFVSSFNKVGKNALIDIVSKTAGEGGAEGGATYLKGKSINSTLDDWGIVYKDESATKDEIINSAIMGSVIGGGVSTVFFLFGLIGAVKNYMQKRAEKKNDQNTVVDKGVRKNMNRKVMNFFVFLFLFIIITILGCYWLGYLISDFTRDFWYIFVKHRNLFSPKGFCVLLSIFMLMGILYLIVYIIYTKKYKKIPLLMSGKTKE